MPVGFRGVTLIAPGVASYIDDSLASAPVTAAPTAMGIVGVAERGEPNVAVSFTDASTAYAYYGLGTDNAPLVRGIVRALAAGAGTVYGVRIGSAKPFEARITGATGNPIVAYSREWGKAVKPWTIQIANASNYATKPGKKIILTTHDGLERQYTVDKIYKEYISVISATSDSGTFAVDNQKITITIGTNPAKEYTFIDYPKLGNLIAAVHNDGVCSIELAKGATSSLETRFLDAPSTPYTINPSNGAVTTIQANTKAVFDVLNTGLLRALVRPVWESNYVLTNGVYGFKYYVTVGGTELDKSNDNTYVDPSITANDWSAGFAKLAEVDVSVVVPMTGDDLFIAHGVEHVRSLSSPEYSKERILVAGGPDNQPMSDAIAMAESFNEKRAVFCWPGIQDYARGGELQIYPPYYLAAQIAGILTSQSDPSEPLTNKSIAVPALEFIPTRDEVDELIMGGVLTLKTDVQRGIIVAQSVTSWTGDLAYARREISTVRAADRTVRAVRESIQQYVGGKSSGTIVGLINQKVKESLENAAAQGWIVTDPTNPSLYPAWKNIVVRPVGDAYYVDFTISPAKPLNYLLITAYVN